MGLGSQCAKGTAGSREQVLKARHVARTTRRRSILGETKSAATSHQGKGLLLGKPFFAAVRMTQNVKVLYHLKSFVGS